MLSRHLRFNAYLLSVLVMSVLTTGCAASDSSERAKRSFFWKEEVRLSNGSLIIVERGETRVLAGEPGTGTGWLFDEAWVKAVVPGVGETRWQGALEPLVLDGDKTGQWYLLGVVGALRGNQDYQVRDPKVYVAFRLIGRSWQRVSFSQFPVEFKPNLLARRYELFVRRGLKNGSLVNLGTKQKLDADPSLDGVYKEIDRQLGD